MTPSRTIEISPLPESVPPIYYDRDRRDYLRQNSSGDWLRLAEPQIKRELRMFGICATPPKGATASQMDSVLSFITTNRDLAFAGPLAGHHAGISEAEGKRILVTDSPRIIEPSEGDCSTIMQVLSGMFPSEERLRDVQKVTFMLWLKLAYESLRAGIRQPGQALCIAGPAECGKSLVQGEIITPVLGGRMARPYPFMAGLSRFNEELFGAEHLAIDDEQASYDIRARLALSASLKQMSVADGQRCEAKFRTPLVLHPFWRVSITLNDEPESLGVLPPIRADIADKLILLRASKVAMPMPTGTPGERAAFAAAINAELPAFIAYLQRLTVPPSLRAPRFGVTHFHHPALLDALGELAPETRLLELIDAAVFDGVILDPWEGTAGELERRLNACSAVQHEARRLLTFPTACGTYLGRLAARGPHMQRIHSLRSAVARRWRITPPPPEPEE